MERPGERAAVAIDDKVKIFGRVPSVEEVKLFLVQA